MHENDHRKIQIDLSPATKRGLRNADARRKPVLKSFTDALESLMGTIVVLIFGALIATAMVYAILWLLENMPPLP